MTTAATHPYLAHPPLALAHRGGAAWAPNRGRENTLPAFVAAVEELGFRHIETDVHATADGVLVALHDERLDRVSDGSGAVADLTFDQVRRARIAGEPVPALAEVFTRLPTTLVNIDLKSPAAVDPLVAELRRHDAHERVCVGSFSNTSLWRFRAATRGRRVATSAGRLGIVALRFLPAWLSRWVHTPGLVFQVPLDQAVGPWRVRVVTPAFVAAAHRIGRDVHVWTIDDPTRMHALLDLGVDGIVTDRPDVLRDVLRARGAWHGPESE